MGVDQPQYSGRTGRQCSVSLLWKFEASLIYIASSRPARATEWDPVSKEIEIVEEEKETAELNIYLDTVKVSAEGGMLCCSELETWEKFYSG